ncbi:hypothetical protein EF910_00060 [Streptomyces sp. WAC07149]|nr:hypothetical protein EF910_00060 [Streptomyces sp. WAC07149]
MKSPVSSPIKGWSCLWGWSPSACGRWTRRIWPSRADLTPTSSTGAPCPQKTDPPAAPPGRPHTSTPTPKRPSPTSTTPSPTSPRPEHRPRGRAPPTPWA